MYKLIAFDCDGTLLNDRKQIDKETIEAIKKVKNRGIKIVIATSKAFYKLQKYLEQLELVDDDHYTVAFNGGYVLNNTENCVLHKELLNAEAVEKIVNFAKKFNLYTFIYEKDKIISNKYCDDYIRHNPDTPFFVDDFNSIDLESLSVHKIIMHSPNANEVSRARLELGTSCDDVCEVTSSNANNIEFIPFGNSKTSGLEKISQKLDIKASEMIAFGDNENDIDMFNYVGYNVAMGNSIDSLKNIANRITLSNNDNGIAKALNEMIEEGII